MNKADIRFEMVKARHKKRFELAVKNSEADKAIVPLCSYINSVKDFFTSSSCSGRILLLGITGKGKDKAYFHRKWHRTVTFDEVWAAIGEEVQGNLWFKMEPFIIHIGTRTLKGACKILDIKNAAGVKRGGIIVAKPGKFMLEIIGTEEIAFPVKIGGKTIVGMEFMKIIIETANKKMEENNERLKKFEETIRGELR